MGGLKEIKRYGLRCKKSRQYVSSITTGMTQTGGADVQFLYSPMQSSAYVFHGWQLAHDFLEEMKLHQQFEIVLLGT